MVHQNVANLVAILVLALCGLVVSRGAPQAQGTKWAVLIAGSNGYVNYRHQADVCHAYQILKRGGLKDENIIVFMYDDIANNPENPHKGVIINRPGGPNVYPGVPKDYTGNAVTGANFLAVILGDEKAVKGGSGKVVKSGPNDHIFIYYTDHGASGLIAMPSGDDLYANTFITTLKKKYASGTYKTMVIYLEACESGSMFEGLLPKGLNIYATTASNAQESSYATYCEGVGMEEYTTCLGDLYSVSWMENSDRADLREETLEKQYEVVKNRTFAGGDEGSHVMQYGDMGINKDTLDLYMGALKSKSSILIGDTITSSVPVEQRDADLIYLRQKWIRALAGSQEKAEARKKLDEALLHREHVDRSVNAIGQFLFGSNDAESMNRVRQAGTPLVDDWDCLKTMVATYKEYCGALNSYGMKYTRAFANICNAGVGKDQMARAAAQACS
ncbi:hypothetical protein Droror1_Dr00017167 [Drosera rotundifolia]